MTPRSYVKGAIVPKSYNNKDDVIRCIDILRKIYQPVQRTPEWYEYRHNLITASSVSKVIGSDAKINM